MKTYFDFFLGLVGLGELSCCFSLCLGLGEWFLLKLKIHFKLCKKYFVEIAKIGNNFSKLRHYENCTLTFFLVWLGLGNCLVVSLSALGWENGFC